MDLTGLGSVADLAKGVIDRIWPSDASADKKLEAQQEVERLLSSERTVTLQAQQAILTAELNQGDNYTKRARPTVVYAGLGFIFLVNVLFPMIAFWSGKPIPALSLPDDFWWAWGSVVSVWSIGRTFERRGAAGKAVSLITGGK